ncbi:hypothetical protein D3C85_1803910 [compost metagenome]
MLPLLAVGGVDLARGVGGAAEGAFLARIFLALQEVEERHEGARDLGVRGAVGGLEHHIEQAGDQAREGGCGLFGGQGLGGDAQS